jgi:Tol biopolymer transport system component
LIVHHHGRERFEREARAASRLNHPNICTLHDVGQHGGVDFLVMEYLEGETLAARLNRGRLLLDDALKHAIAIADALDKAHAAGITHRDLKPSNVMLTKTGPKLLDFGLARLDVSGSFAASESVTQSGVVAGTLPYMAPEQLQGKKADARTDIFAFGAVLYEMLTGDRPFRGDNEASLIAAILKTEPPLAAAIPARLDQIVRKCLAKDPEERWRSIHDVAIQLQWIAAEPASSTGSVSPRQTLPRRAKTRWIAIGAATAIAVVLVVYAVGSRFLQPPEVPGGIAQRVEFSIPVPETVRGITGLSVSPDGSRVSFVGGGQLWVHEIATRATRPIHAVTGFPFPFWSPDGQFIAFFQGGKLKRIPAAGGIPHEICDVPAGRGGSWAADDTIIFTKATDGIFRVHAGGGTPVRVTAPVALGRSHMWPHFLPGGKHFTYYGSGSNTVYVASLDPNEPRRPVATIESEAYVASDFMLTTLDGVLRAQRSSSNPAERAGEAIPLTANVIKPTGDYSGNWAFAASPDVLVYNAAQPRRYQFSSVDREGGSVVTLGPPSLINGPWDLSTDGSKVAFRQLNSEGRTERIWRLDVGRETITSLTSDAGSDRQPVWSPLGDQIVFTRVVEPLQVLYLKRLDGGPETPIGESNSRFKPAWDWHPDGRTVLTSRQMPPNNQNNFWLLRTDDDQNPKLWFESDSNHLGGQFSPNGRWVAYLSNESGGPNIYVRRFPEADSKVTISTSGGAAPRWRPDGNALFYIETSSGNLMEVDLKVGATTINAGPPRKLFDLQASIQFAVMPDGKRFIVCRPVDPAPPPTITVVLNWTAGLKRE